MCGSVVATSGFNLHLKYAKCRTRKQWQYVFEDVHVACQSELEQGSKVEKERVL